MKEWKQVLCIILLNNVFLFDIRNFGMVLSFKKGMLRRDQKKFYFGMKEKIKKDQELRS